MTALEKAYEQFTIGGTSFCQYVESHCGFDLSREEIERIADMAQTAAEFEDIWANSDKWTDANNA